MANLGTIGKKSCETKASPDLTPGARLNFSALVCSGQYFSLGGKDVLQGNPQPSLRIDNRGRWRLHWTVPAGTRTIQIDCLQAVNVSPYPTLIVKANPAVGLNSDQVATAPAGAGWKTIGPLSINISSPGGVWVELHNNYLSVAGGAPCYFDNVVVT